MSSRPPPARDLSATVLDVPPPPGWRRLPGGVYGRRHDDLAVMVTLDHDGAEPRVWASASRRGRYPSDLEVRAALAALVPSARDVAITRGGVQPGGRHVVHADGARDP